MRNDAGEQREDEGDALHGGRRAALLVMRNRDPGEQEQKGDVNADLAAEQACDGKGPSHDKLAGTD
jgi:hypothetical protein